MEKYKDSIREYAYCFILGPFFMIIEACGEFILPYLNANIIDKGAANGDIPFILQNGLYMLVTALIMLAGGVLGAYFAIKGSSHLAADVREKAFARIQTFPFANIDAFSMCVMRVRKWSPSGEKKTCVLFFSRRKALL